MRRIRRVHYDGPVATNMDPGATVKAQARNAKSASTDVASPRTVTADLRPEGSEDSGVARGMKTSERIAATIVADIAAQGLVPGDRLPNEAAMIERFQLGRGSVREALRILEVHGIIQLRSGPGGGPVVAAVRPPATSPGPSPFTSIRSGPRWASWSMPGPSSSPSSPVSRPSTRTPTAPGAASRGPGPRRAHRGR